MVRTIKIIDDIYDFIRELFEKYLIFSMIGIVLYIPFIAEIIGNPDSYWNGIYEKLGNGWENSLGRFGLSPLSILSDGVISPIFSCIFSIVLLSVIIMLFCKIFNIINRFQIAIVSIIFYASLNFADLLTYQYCDVQYVISYVLMILSIYIVNKSNKVMFNIFAILLGFISLSIYQSYIVSAVTICVIIVMYDIFNHILEIKKILRFLIFGISSLVLYFVILKILDITGYLTIDASVNDALKIKNIFIQIINCYICFVHYYLTDNIVNNSFLGLVFINMVVLLFIIYNVVVFVIKKDNKIIEKILLIIFTLLLPVATMLSQIIFNNRFILWPTAILQMPANIYIYIYAIILFNICNINNKKMIEYFFNLLLIVMSLIMIFKVCIFEDCMYNNINVGKYVISDVVKELDEIDDIKNKRVCVLGNIDFGMEKQYDIVKGTVANSYIAWDAMVYQECYKKFIQFYFKRDFNFVEFDKEMEIYQSDLHYKMPQYPDMGYVDEMDDVVIVNLNK